MVNWANGISTDSAIFAQLTAESRYTLQWTAPFPLKIAPSHGDLNLYLIHGSLGMGPPQSLTQTASLLVQPFCTAHKCPNTLQWPAPHPLKTARSNGGFGPHLIRWGLIRWPTRVLNPAASRPVEPFCRAHYCDKPTDQGTRSVTIGRIMRPNNTIFV